MLGPETGGMLSSLGLSVPSLTDTCQGLVLHGRGASPGFDGLIGPMP